MKIARWWVVGISLFVCCTIAVATGAASAQSDADISSAVAAGRGLNDYLIGYWPFNGNANDESGQGYAGTPLGVTLASDRYGVTNRAYAFDGSGDYISVPGFRQPGSAISEVMWVYLATPAPSGYRTLTSQSWGSHQFGYNANGQFNLELYAAGHVVNTFTLPSTLLPSNTWTFIAFTAVTSGAVNIYINNTRYQVGYAPATIHGMTNDLRISHSDNSLFGRIDDLRVYRTALTEAEVLELFYAQSPSYIPSGVSATDGTYSDKVRVSWTSISGATSYEIWRSANNSSGTATLLGTSTGTSYDDTSAVANTVYYYWVKAKVSSYSSDFSSSDSGYSYQEATIAAPSGVSASDGNYSDKVRVTWTSVSGATGYELWRGTANSSGSASILTELSLTTMYDDTAATADVIYYYWVKARTASSTSTFSSSDSGYRASQSAGLSAPTGVAASDGTYTDKVRISWTAASGATSYEVWRNTANNSSGASKLSDATDTTYDDTTASADTIYYYWVKARDASGASSFSSADSGYRASSQSGLEPPSTVLATDGTYTNMVRVSWTSVEGATSYELYRAWTNDTSQASLAGSTDQTSYDDTGVLAGVRNYYWVKSMNSDGASRFSNPDSGYSSLGSSASGTADLSVTNLVFLPRVLSAGANPETISLQLSNNGPSAMSFPSTRVTLDFYLSQNSSFGDSDDVWIGEYATDATLASGASSLVLLSGTTPAGIAIPSSASGSYYVFVRASHSSPSTLLDTNGNNDMTVRSGTILIGEAGSGNAANDFNGDGVSDLAIYAEAMGGWFVKSLDGTIVSWGTSWGGVGLEPLAGDFDGDGKSDLATYYEPYGWWFIETMSGSILAWGTSWGGSGMKPVVGDYNMDGKSDLAVYSDAAGYWFISTLSGTILSWGELWGGAGFSEVSGDYTGDGKADMAVYSESTAAWYVRGVDGSMILWGQAWGGPGFVAVPGDYDGDGIADLVVYNRTLGTWYGRTVAGAILMWGTSCGGSGFVPVPGDYDGDGKSDLAVYNETAGQWFIFTASGSLISWATAWGGPGMAAVGAVE